MRKNIFLLICALVAILVVAACGGGEEPTATPAPAAAADAAAPPAPVAMTGDAAAGKTTYGTICIACHGPEGKGVTGLGKDLTTSTFVADLDDAGLVEFIKKGRDASDPLNTTGIAMPPKAGNPALSDQEIYNVVAFVRSIHQQ